MNDDEFDDDEFDDDDRIVTLPTKAVEMDDDDLDDFDDAAAGACTSGDPESLLM